MASLFALNLVKCLGPPSSCGPIAVSARPSPEGPRQPLPRSAERGYPKTHYHHPNPLYRDEDGDDVAEVPVRESKGPRAREKRSLPPKPSIARIRPSAAMPPTSGFVPADAFAQSGSSNTSHTYLR